MCLEFGIVALVAAPSERRRAGVWVTLFFTVVVVD